MSEHTHAQQQANTPQPAVVESAPLEQKETVQADYFNGMAPLFANGSTAFAEPRSPGDLPQNVNNTGNSGLQPNDSAAFNEPRFHIDLTEVPTHNNPAQTHAIPQPGPQNELETDAGTAGSSAPGPSLIVEDSTVLPAPGQMRKSEFLLRLQTDVTETVEAAIVGTCRSTEDCPYLEYWFDFYRRQDSAHIERALRAATIHDARLIRV